MGPKKLAKVTGLDFDKAKELIAIYFSKFQKIKLFFDDFVAKSISARCAVSPYDGRLKWLEFYDWDSRRDQALVRNACMNFPMQSGNASITKRALTLIRERIKGKDIQILSTIHDEILLEARTDLAKEAEKILVSSMIEAAKEYLANVRVEVESKIAPYWSK